MKKYVGKRFLSMLLAFVMVLTMLPMSVLAGSVTDAVSGAVDTVLDGVDFNYKGIGISMGFGGEVDPGALLPDYDVKAVGAIKMSAVKDAVTGELKPTASGDVELYVPYKVFTDAYAAAVESVMKSIYDAGLTTAMATKITETQSQDVTDYVKTTYPTFATLPVPGTASQSVSVPMGDAEKAAVAAAIKEQIMATGKVPGIATVTVTVGDPTVTVEVAATATLEKATATVTLDGTLSQVIDTLLDKETKHSVDGSADYSVTTSAKITAVELPVKIVVEMLGQENEQEQLLTKETIPAGVMTAIEAAVDKQIGSSLPPDQTLNVPFKDIREQYGVDMSINYRTLLGDTAIKALLVSLFDKAKEKVEEKFDTTIAADGYDSYAQGFWAEATLTGYDNAVDAAAKAAVIDSQVKQLLAVLVTRAKVPTITTIDTTSGMPYFKTAEVLRAEIASFFVAQVENGMMQYINRFYGELLTGIGETLTSRFTNLKNGIQAVVQSIAGDSISVEIPLPTDKISTIEELLKGVVAKLNGTSADEVTITGRILGNAANPGPMTVQKDTGIYIVAGVNSADLDDMQIHANVIAPELVKVQIQANNGDESPLLKATVGETDGYTITATTAGTVTEGGYVPDDANLMELRIDGLTTSGKRYSDSDKHQVAAPSDAGVYTVLSIYLDKTTLAMGANLAVLVVEPAKTTEEDFHFTNDPDELTVIYDKLGHYPSIETELKHAVIKGAINEEQNAAYIMYPANLDNVVGSVEDKAADILEELNKQATGLHLPTAGLTNHALVALEKLSTYAQQKIVAGEDGGELTAAEVKAYLVEYLSALQQWYDYDNLKEMGVEAYKAALNAVAQIEDAVVNNQTVAEYTDLIGTMMDTFESFNKQAKNDQVTYSLRAAADTSVVEEIAKDASDEAVGLARKVLNTMLAKAGVTSGNMKDVVLAAVDYASGTVKNNKYYADAVTLIETLGAATGASRTTIDAAIAEVKAAFIEMVEGGENTEGMKAHIKEFFDVETFDVETIVNLETFQNLGMDDAKHLAVHVLQDVEFFVSVVMEQAKAVVNNTDWTVNKIYFNVEPTEVGTYNCYAVNVNPNYIPNLTRTTLEIVEVEVTVAATVAPATYTVDSGAEAPVVTITAVDSEGNSVANIVDGTYTITKGGEAVADLATALKTAGTYTITPNFVEPVGYKVIEVTSATLTVEDAAHVCTPGEAVKENEVAADCENDGSYDEVVYCSECGEEISRTTVTVDALGHTDGEAVKENEVAADCKNDGSYDNVVYCTVCGEELSRETITVDALGHDWDDGVEKEANCGEWGGKVYTCLVCGETNEELTVAPSGDHTHEVYEVVPPTCTEDGYTVYKCGVCGHEHNSDPVTATGHSYEETVVPPTCGEDGYTDNVCSVCGDAYKDNEVPATGEHSYEETGKTAPICVKPGYTTYTCSVCGDSYYEVGAPATGVHTGGTAKMENVIEGTCVTPGSHDEVVYCTGCGLELSREHVDDGLGGHDYSGDEEKENMSNPTDCQEPGFYDSVLYCCLCDVELVRNKVEIPPLPHVDGSDDDDSCDYGCGTVVCNHKEGDAAVEELPAVEATCTEAGLTAGLRCKEHEVVIKYQESIPALGHTKTAAKKIAEKAATCTESGYEQYAIYCETCGKLLTSWTRGISSKGGHVDTNKDGFCDNSTCSAQLCPSGEHTNVVVVKEKQISATCTANGSYVKVEYCLDCNTRIHEETVVVDATGHVKDGSDNVCGKCGASLCGGDHTWELIKQTVANCGENGYDIYTCVMCHVNRYDLTGTATGNHTTEYVPAVYDRNSTHHYLVCEVCDQQIRSGAHEFGELENDFTQTCSICGYKVQKRLFINEFLSEHIPEALKEKYDTVDKIEAAMETEVMNVVGNDVKVVNTVVQDVTLKRYVEGENDEEGSWVEITEENFPAGGLTISIPVPVGFDASKHEIYVTHLCAESGDIEVFCENPDTANGEKLLKIENGMMIFDVQSLSPFGVSWTEDIPGGSTEEVNYKFYWEFQVRLIEPWSMRAKVQFYDPIALTPVDMSTLTVNEYGYYMVRDSELNGAEATVENIIANAETVVFKSTDGSAYKDGGRFAAEYNKDIFTFQLRDPMHIVFYYDVGHGIQYSTVYHANLKTLIQRQAGYVGGTTEADVLNAMDQLEDDITDYRSTFTDPGDGLDRVTPPTLNASNLPTKVENTAYKFATEYNVIVTEPWGLRIGFQVRDGANTSTVISGDTFDDYGVVVFYDVNDSLTGTVTVDQILAMGDEAVVYNKSMLTTDSGYYRAIYNKNVFTYQMDAKAYIVFYVVKDGQTYYSTVGSQDMLTLANARIPRIDTSTERGKAEKAVLEDMIVLFEKITAHRG